MKVLCPTNDTPFSTDVRMTRDLGGVNCELVLKSTFKGNTFIALLESKFRDTKKNAYIKHSDLSESQHRNLYFSEVGFHQIFKEEEIFRMEQKVQTAGCFLNQVSFMDKHGQMWPRSLSTLNYGVPWIEPMAISVEFHPEDRSDRFWRLLEGTSWRTVEHLRDLISFVEVQSTQGRPPVHRGKIAFSIGQHVHYSTLDELPNEFAVANLMNVVICSFGGVTFLPITKLPMPVIGIDGNMKGDIAATFFNTNGVFSDHYMLNAGRHGELRTPETLHHILDVFQKQGRISRDLPFILHVDGKLTGPLKREIPAYILKFPLMEIVELPKYVSPLIGRENGNGSVGDYAILSEDQGVVVANAQMSKFRCPSGTFVQKVYGTLSIHDHLATVYQLCRADPFSVFQSPGIPSSIRLAMDKLYLAKNLLRAYRQSGIIE